MEGNGEEGKQEDVERGSWREWEQGGGVKAGWKGKGSERGMFASFGFGRINAHCVCPNLLCLFVRLSLRWSLTLSG